MDEYHRGGPTVDTDFHQVDRADGGGNAPEPMLINVWNLRFLAADQTTAGPALLDGKLDWTPARAAPDDPGGQFPRVVGTIKNLTGKPVTGVRIRTAAGYARDLGGQATYTGRPLVDQIDAGASVRVDASVQGSPDLPSPGAGYHYDRYGFQQLGPIADALLWRVAGDLAGRRAHRADLLVASGRWAAIYAEAPDAEPPAVLREPDAKQRHYELIRALVPLGGPRPSQLGADPSGPGARSPQGTEK
jgi:hypothetical protein